MQEYQYEHMRAFTSARAYFNGRRQKININKQIVINVQDLRPPLPSPAKGPIDNGLVSELADILIGFTFVACPNAWPEAAVDIQIRIRT